MMETGIMAIHNSQPSVHPAHEHEITLDRGPHEGVSLARRQSRHGRERRSHASGLLDLLLRRAGACGRLIELVDR